MSQGNNGITTGEITETLTKKVDNDLSNLDSTVFPKGIDYVVDWQMPTAGNNYTWYRKYKSGWIEQGGKVAKATAATVTINLIVEMSDNQWCFSTSAANSKTDSTVNFAQFSAWNRTTTSFSTRCSDVSDKDWQVSGMAAV